MRTIPEGGRFQRQDQISVAVAEIVSRVGGVGMVEKEMIKPHNFSLVDPDFSKRPGFSFCNLP